MKRFTATLAALAITTMAHANVTVGMIDAGPITGPARPGVTVEPLMSTENPTKYGHASMSLDALTRGFAPDASTSLTVLYVNAFEADASTSRANEVIVDWPVIVQAMIAFKKRGVKYVCTTFSDNDSENAVKVTSFAHQLGLVIVASLGNGETKTPYPAMLPNVVAVLGSEAKVVKNLRARADYTISGQLTADVRGSSFAAARMCGQLSRAG